MSDARSLTPLSETDYDAIASAVLETARGRWFMNEYAKRNRQADTTQLLSAIGRIERVIAQTEVPGQRDLPDLSDAIALIIDLRTDLERLGGKAHDPSTGLSARIETASGSIIAAAENIQEIAWGLRESGADEAFCDKLDRRATEIYAATVIVEGTAQQIAKIADTVAMLDSNLRAFAEGAHRMAPEAGATAAPSPMPVAPSHPGTRVFEHDIDIIEVKNEPRSVLAPTLVLGKGMDRKRIGAIDAGDNDDIAFIDIEEMTVPDFDGMAIVATSETRLREIDALQPIDKLAYFA